MLPAAGLFYQHVDPLTRDKSCRYHYVIDIIGGDEDEERMFSPYEYLMGALKGNQTPDSARYDSPDPTGFTSVDFLMEQIGILEFQFENP